MRLSEVTIVLKDLPNGQVDIKITPNIAKMIQIEVSGAGLTAAEGYAFLAYNTISKESRGNDQRIIT